MPGPWNNSEGRVAMEAEMARLPSEPERVVYCYRVQAWVVGDQIDSCEHPEVRAGCYACNYMGEVHDLDCPDCN